MGECIDDKKVRRAAEDGRIDTRNNHVMLDHGFEG